jgi:single-stranded DNA-binding protein
MNVITVVGRVGNIKVYPPKTPDKKVMLILGVADRYWGGREAKVQWWNCKVYGSRAENIAKFIEKGSMVSIVGRVNSDDFTPKDGGPKRQSWQVFVDQIEVAPPPAGRGEAPRHAPEVQTFTEDDASSWSDAGPGDDIPF